MACCSASSGEYIYEDSTPIVAEGSHDTVATDDSEVLNNDYRKATPLFRHIERENWEGVLSFLNTGKWATSILSSSNEHLRSPGPEIQVKTWVTSYDRNGEPEWSQLPIHAAISYMAPFIVIKKLIQFYPKGIHCTDNEGMLPAHLAWGFGAPDNVIALLLEPFPGAVNEKGLGGRYPYECCELGPNKTRGTVFKIVGEQIEARTRVEMEQELREFSTQAAKTVGLNGASNLSSSKPVTQFILELLQDRKELIELKAKNAAAAAKVVATREASATVVYKPKKEEVKQPSKTAPQARSVIKSTTTTTTTPISSGRTGRKGLLGSKMKNKSPTTTKTGRGRNGSKKSSSTPEVSQKFSV